jgi:hypothetical protein
MFVKCQIFITIIDPRGWVNGADISAHLDTNSDLLPQCIAEAQEWVDRRNRCHGTEFKLSAVTDCVFEYRGFWNSVKLLTKDSEPRWPSF